MAIRMFDHCRAYTILTSMPSEIVQCVLSDRWEGVTHSNYTKITTSEREEKIYEGYKKHNDQSLNYSLIDEKVHIS